MTEVETANFTSGLSAQMANVMRATFLHLVSIFLICGYHTHENYTAPFKRFYKLFCVSDDIQNQILRHYISEIFLRVYYFL